MWLRPEILAAVGVPLGVQAWWGVGAAGAAGCVLHWNRVLDELAAPRCARVGCLFRT